MHGYPKQRSAAGDPVSVSVLDEIRQRSARYFSECLWHSEAGRSAVAHMAKLGISELTLRQFSIGYAPGDWADLLDHLEPCDYEPGELEAAGVALTSGRGGVHVRFRARLMFPATDGEGRVLGFAGLATNPGPSWPQWSISPEGAGFNRSDALLGLGVAASEVLDHGRATVFDDGVEMLRAHQRGQDDAVAAVRTRVGLGQVRTLCAVLGVGLAQVEVSRGVPGENTAASLRVCRLARLLSSEPIESAADGDESDLALPRGYQHLEPTERRLDPPDLTRQSGGVRPDPISIRSPLANALLQISRGIVGVGIPIGWLVILGVDTGAPGGSGTAFVGAVAGVAITYLVIALLVAVVSGRVRLRSGSRRMRGVWARGATEWEPPAWTYHFLEDLSIGAAIISVFVCLILFLTIGGFID